MSPRPGPNISFIAVYTRRANFSFSQKRGVSLKIPIADPISALASYIEYFLLVQQSPSLVIPDFARALLKGAASDLHTAMGKYASYKDPYLNYIKAS